MNFKPGELSKEQADALNRLARQVAQLQGITATPPLTINKSGFNPILALSEAYQPLLAEITVKTTDTPPQYTVKRKTRDSTNAVVDMVPGVIIPNVITPDQSDLPLGTLVNIEAIPDWPLPEQWWWAKPANPGQNVSGADCSSFLGLIRANHCFSLSIVSEVGDCDCVDITQTADLIWDTSLGVATSNDLLYGCQPGVITTDCPAPGAPKKWSFVVAGFTGTDCTAINGNWTITWTSGQTWVRSQSGVTATLVLSGTTGTLTFTLDADDSVLAVYSLNPFLCCAENVLARDSFAGCDAAPANLTLIVATSCGLGTPYTAYLNTCTDSCGVPHQRLRWIAGSGSGAHTITFTPVGCGTTGGQPYADFATDDPLLCTGTAAIDCGPNKLVVRVVCGSCGIPFVCEGVTFPGQICITLTNDALTAYILVTNPTGTNIWTGSAVVATEGDFAGCEHVFVADATLEAVCADGCVTWNLQIIQTDEPTGFCGSLGTCTINGTAGPYCPPELFSGMELDCDNAFLPSWTGAATDGSSGCTAVPIYPTWNCVSGSCVAIYDGTGEFPTEGECAAGCGGVVTWDCVSGSCVPVAGTGGAYATEAECVAACTGSDACCANELDGTVATVVIVGGVDAGTYNPTWSTTSGVTRIDFIGSSTANAYFVKCVAASAVFVAGIAPASGQVIDDSFNCSSFSLSFDPTPQIPPWPAGTTAVTVS